MSKYIVTMKTAIKYPKYEKVVESFDEADYDTAFDRYEEMLDICIKMIRNGEIEGFEVTIDEEKQPN